MPPAVRSSLTHPLRYAIFSLGLLLVSAASLASIDNCESARLRDPPATRETWHGALGPDSTEFRIRTKMEPDKWVLIYSPKWSSMWLIGQRRPWPPDPLRVAWDDIARLDTRVTSGPGRGRAIGGAIGAGIAISLGVACAIGDDDTGSICPLASMVVGAVTVPLGVLLGGSLASNPQWVPVLCTDDRP
jgi:hypothetical protein